MFAQQCLLGFERGEKHSATLDMQYNASSAPQYASKKGNGAIHTKTALPRNRNLSKQTQSIKN
jgi:hypothetical protein